MENLKTHSKAIREMYFIVGVVATIAYRIIIIFSGSSEFWLNLCWYTGTIGFVIYFAHRFQISENRAKVIKEKQLEEKVKQIELSPEDKEAMAYVFKSLNVSTERWIYIIIFVSSALALIAGIYLDFIAK
ncbi:MAG: hypothetical protein WCV58_04085 [Patescibacteria group bacterium]